MKQAANRYRRSTAVLYGANEILQRRRAPGRNDGNGDDLCNPSDQVGVVSPQHAFMRDRVYEDLTRPEIFHPSRKPHGIETRRSRAAARVRFIR